jgi:aspartyl-tRNA(Asn)/glutamyl-tRNA(Gln) amidotransferase subunit B
MEEGSLRCDANVSIRPRGTETLGTRAEIKNLNSFRNVARAIDHEIARQGALLSAGGHVVQETRLWNADRGETSAMRSKEDAHDYRYFPEPDLPPLVIDGPWLDEVRASLPELPAARRGASSTPTSCPRTMRACSPSRPRWPTTSKPSPARAGNAKAASNWVMTEVLRKVKDDDRPLAACPVAPGRLAELLKLVDGGAITGTSAKVVFERMWASGEDARTIVEREGLAQVSDEGAIEAAIAEVVAASPEQVATYRKGKTSTLGWFVGQVMRKTGGKANPQLVNALLKKTLEGGRAGGDNTKEL